MKDASSSHAADRARGLLLGAALGDAMGAPFEGHSSVDDALLVGAERSSELLRYTDDTALTLVLARHLVERRDFAPLDEDDLAREFASAWQEEPWRGYGSGSRRVFELVVAGVPWAEAGRAAFSGQGSYGNGAAMRVAPIALVATGLENAAELARRSAVVTHAHRQGQEGAVLQACAAFLALHSASTRPLDRQHFLDELGRIVGLTEWQERLDRIRVLSESASPRDAASRLGNEAAAITSVPMAIHAFLRYSDQPAEAIHYAISAGGDADTIASMAGALAGARTGVHCLPPAWVDRLEDAEHMRRLADRLARRIPSRG